MKTLLKTYLLSMLGPIGLLNNKKYPEFFVSSLLLLAIVVLHSFIGEIEVFYLLIFIYLLLNTSYTYYSVSSVEDNPNENMYNGLMAFLSTCLFGCGFIAIFELSNININSNIGILLQAIGFFCINFFAIFLNKENSTKVAP